MLTVLKKSLKLDRGGSPAERKDSFHTMINPQGRFLRNAVDRYFLVGEGMNFFSSIQHQQHFQEWSEVERSLMVK